MDRTELGKVAWELVEHTRASLTDAEANTAFVLLGIGEYGEAMGLALRAVARSQDPTLPPPLLARLTQLPHTHFVDDEFVALLAELTGGDEHPGRGEASAFTLRPRRESASNPHRHRSLNAEH